MSDPQQPPNPYLNQYPGQYPGQYPVQQPGQHPGPYPGQNQGQYPMNSFGNPQETPLQLPAYGIGLGGAVKRAFRKYATFTGRASLSEYWWFVLFGYLVSIVMLCFFMAVSVSTMDPVTEDPSGLAIIVFLLWGGVSAAMFLPTLAVTSRRLHDANFSGGMLFLYLVPGVGQLILTILCLFPSTPAGARFDAGFSAYQGYRPGGY